MKQQYIWILISFIASLLVQLFTETELSDETNTIQKSCPALDKCIDSCPNGFIINKYGCETCECNPCRFGQPLYKSPCGHGQNICTANNGQCNVSTEDNAYCCPNERPGSCPSSRNSPSRFCSSSDCKNDFNCSIGQKCCGSCSRCVNATL